MDPDEEEIFGSPHTDLMEMLRFVESTQQPGREGHQNRMGMTEVIRRTDRRIMATEAWQERQRLRNMASMMTTLRPQYLQALFTHYLHPRPAGLRLQCPQTLVVTQHPHPRPAGDREKYPTIRPEHQISLQSAVGHIRHQVIHGQLRTTFLKDSHHSVVDGSPPLEAPLTYQVPLDPLRCIRQAQHANFAANGQQRGGPRSCRTRRIQAARFARRKHTTIADKVKVERRKVEAVEFISRKTILERGSMRLECKAFYVCRSFRLSSNAILGP